MTGSATVDAVVERAGPQAKKHQYEYILEVSGVRKAFPGVVARTWYPSASARQRTCADGRKRRRKINNADEDRCRRLYSGPTAIRLREQEIRLTSPLDAL